jgi:hypothetical protein
MPPSQSGTPQAAATATTTAPVAPPATATPSAVYEALSVQRDLLGDQLRGLERSRSNVAGELRRGNLSDVDRSGLEQRLASLDQQIAQVSINIRESDAAVAQAAAIPGAVVPPPPSPPRDRAPEVIMLGLVVTALLLLPLVLAQARRIWRKQAVRIELTPELQQRLGAMEQGIDAIALEVERIGEGQRFVSQLLSGRQQQAIEAERAKGR